MSKKSDDSLEHFFRKAVKQYDEPFMEEDWRKMEKMLDEKAVRDAAVRTKRIRQYTASSIAVLLLVSAVYFTGFYTGTPDETLPVKGSASADSETLKEEGHQNPSALISSSDDATGSIDSTNILNNDESDAIKTSPEFTGVQSQAVKSESKVSSENSSNNRTSIIGIQSKSQTNVNKSPTHIAAVNTGDHAEEKVSNQHNNTTENERVVAVDTTVLLEQQNVSLKAASQLSLTEEKNDSLTQEALISKQDSVADALLKDDAEEKIKETWLSRWSVTLAIAPDFSSAGLGRYTSPGEAYGLLLRYEFRDRFSISAGLLRSSKRYEGTGNDYSPPEGYWARRTNGIIPDKIDGSCLVYEVPVMLQYDFARTLKWRAFGALGLSSYRIANQRYEYFFNQENPGAATDWATTEPATYKFNIGHLSLGYERQVFPKISLGLEPYLKVPFTGMGWSDVDLFSTGVFLNIRYTISKKVRTE